MSPAGVAFILIILVISASVFITVSNMNKTVQDLNNTISSISTELNTIKQAINMTEDYRVLLSLLGSIALEKLEKAIVLEDYIIHVVQGVGSGDILAPHLYDWFFDGVNDYLVIGLQPDGSGNPFTVYGWSEITITEQIYPVWPKANTEWSKTSMMGDGWVDYPSTAIVTDNKLNYTWLPIYWTTMKSDGKKADYYTNIYAYRNTWVHIVRRFTSARELSYWVNNVKAYSVTIPSTEYTILEWNPSTARYPHRYKRFVLGANVELREWMTLYQSYLIIHSRALADTEIQIIYNAKIVNASSLEIFIDPTFTINNMDFYNLGRYNTTIKAYNGVSKVKANETWIWTLRNATADPGVWLRFFPSGTIIVYRTGEIEKITSTEYYTNRTDIMLIMIPKEAIG